MDVRACETLEMVYAEPSPGILWDDLIHLCWAVAVMYGGDPDPFISGPGITWHLKMSRTLLGPRVLAFPYASKHFEGQIGAIREFFKFEGVEGCR